MQKKLLLCGRDRLTQNHKSLVPIPDSIPCEPLRFRVLVVPVIYKRRLESRSGYFRPTAILPSNGVIFLVLQDVYVCIGQQRTAALVSSQAGPPPQYAPGSPPIRPFSHEEQPDDLVSPVSEVEYTIYFSEYLLVPSQPKARRLGPLQNYFSWRLSMAPCKQDSGRKFQHRSWGYPTQRDKLDL